MSPHSGSKRTPATELIDLKKQVADLKESAIARRRVEDALRAAEDLHRSTLEEAPAGILRLDSSGRLLYANPAFLRVLGYSSRQDFNGIGGLRGIFLNDQEARRVVQLAVEAPATALMARCLLREGNPVTLRLLASAAGPDQAVTLVVQPELPPDVPQG